MSGAGLVIDAFDRIKGVVHHAADGLSPAELQTRLDADANSIGWLIWHLTRIQDDHIAVVAGTAEVYASGGWWEQLGRPFGLGDDGYGQTSKDVAALRLTSAQVLLEYHDAVHDATVEFVSGLTDEDFNRVVDTNWDPPVTLGVRLISVVSDCLQHAGQAAFVRGVIDRA